MGINDAALDTLNLRISQSERENIYGLSLENCSVGRKQLVAGSFLYRFAGTKGTSFIYKYNVAVDHAQNLKMIGQVPRVTVGLSYSDDTFGRQGTIAHFTIAIYRYRFAIFSSRSQHTSRFSGDGPTF